MISFTTPRTCSNPIVSVKNIGRRETRSKYGRLEVSERTPRRKLRNQRVICTTRRFIITKNIME
jgi:hypothetical protein